MPSTSPCGIGGSQTSDGQCTGTYGQQASQAGAHVFDGVTSHPVVLALLAAGVLVAVVLFVRWVVSKVGTFFGDRRSEAERIRSEVEAADRHAKSFRRGFDYEGFGQAMHDVGGYEDDAEDDTEDDSDILEDRSEARA